MSPAEIAGAVAGAREALGSDLRPVNPGGRNFPPPPAAPAIPAVAEHSTRGPVEDRPYTPPQAEKRDLGKGFSQYLAGHTAPPVPAAPAVEAPAAPAAKNESELDMVLRIFDGTIVK
jgi:hypothetical protein